MAYQRPMVTVDQNMTITPTSLERDQPAFIFGPNYELHRYENADEKAKSSIGPYSWSSTPLEAPYPDVLDEEMVDKSYTKLFGDNVLVQIKEPVQASYENAVHDGVDCGKLTLDLDGYGINTTTILRVSVYNNGSSSSPDDDEFETRFLTKILAYGDQTDDSSSPTGLTEIWIEDQITELDDDQYIMVDIVDSYSGVEFTSKDYFHMYGYQWEQPSEKMVDPDTDAEFYGVRVNKLYALLHYDGDPDEGRYYPVISADLYVSYRELIDTYSDTLHTVLGASEVANAVGKVDPDNPLAQGLYMACLNAATDDGDEVPPVYYMATPSDDLDGYNHVLNRATTTDKVYVLAPTTRDESVLEAVRAHCLEMSAKTVKQWRIAAVSAEIPDTVDRLNKLFDPQGDDFFAIVPEDNVIRVVRDKTSTKGNQDTKFRSTVVKGDKVRFNFHHDRWGDYVNDTYTVKKVVNNYTLEVEEDLAASTTAKIVEVYHVYTAAESADVVASVSTAFATRRMLNVFPSVFSNDGVFMTGEFAACAVAGLVSGTEPHQPITNMTVRGIDDIPLTYQTYNKVELDTIAAGGTFIVCQDLPYDKVYVRHQITTAYPDGNLNTAELSITKNVDYISYMFAEAFRPYYGRYNITPGLLAVFQNLATALLNQLGSVDSLYGPQVILENTEIKYVKQNELMKDHVDIGITLGVPYPCNVIDIVLTV